MSRLRRLLRSFDHYQQRRPALGFPIAVGKKFGDDQAGYLAALVAYFGFFSFFPLLLVLVTVLGFVLGRNSAASAGVVHTVLARVPIVGSQISAHGLRGSGVGLAVGLVFTLLAGIGVIQALQYGMNEVWEVPMTERPKFLASRLKALLMLAVLGGATLAATALAGIGSAGAHLAPVLSIVGPLASFGLDFVIVLVAFRVLTNAEVSWGQVMPGALFTGVALAILQALGGFYVLHELKNASQTYGTFATVIALLSWLFLGAQITFAGAEINVVKTKHLWPRAIASPPTEAGERALAAQAQKQQRRPGQSIQVGFGDSLYGQGDVALPED